MIGFKFNTAKSNFFDRKPVMDATTRAERKNLSKFGADVRRVAQKSIQVREGASRPGRPPHGHKTGKVHRKSKRTGKTRVHSVSLLRENILFAYEPQKHGVVIGPVLLNGTVAGANALEALEFGGESVGQFVEKDRVVTKRISVEARPFMVPARDAVLPTVDRDWLDSIR